MSNNSEDLTPEAADRLVLDIVSNRISGTDISPSGELVRAIERYHHNRVAASAQIISSTSSVSSNTNAALSRVQRITNDSQRERLQRMVDILSGVLERHPTMNVASTTSTTQSSSESPPHRLTSSPHIPLNDSFTTGDNRRRPAMTESNSYMRRFRMLADDRRAIRRARSNESLTGIANLQHAGQQLENASQHLRALLDESLSAMAQNNNLTTQEHAGEAEVNRAIKRRKIDSGSPGPSFFGFKPYGHYGQVEPGKLTMEIHSCDGGIFNDERGAKFAAENVLKNDKSVYCTKGNRCNLVLRHQGSSPFTLSELVIKAPPRGYTAPVQEGMVFISMTSDDLLNRTAQYQIQYSPSKTRRRPSQDGPSTLSPGIFSVRHNADGTIENITRIANSRLHRHPASTSASPTEEDTNLRQAQIPDDFILQNADAFNVTCECSDDEDDLRSSRRPPDRIGALRFEESDHEDSEDEDRPWPEDNLLGVSRDIPLPRRLERRSEASRFSISQDLEAAQEAAQEATQEAVKAVGGGLMTPHCKFFIERDKSKCTIKFTPAVSGRFILLKLWSPTRETNGNIDIQNVIVKGYAGTRFFPAGKMR